MRRPLSLALAALALPWLLGLASCDSKPSCKRLVERMKKCGSEPSSGLSEERRVQLCERRRDRPGTRAQIACSRESSCKAFNACLAGAREKERRALLERRWAEVSAAAARGDYAKAFTFCDVRKDELTAPMRRRCDELPAEIVAALTRELTAMRDRGEIPEKSTKCWELRRVALRVGPEARRAADDLCEELMVARRLGATRAEVAKTLAIKRPFLTYGCHVLRLEELVKRVRSPYTLKAQAELVDLCLRKLGKAILEQRVPTQTRCEVRDVVDAIRKLGVKDPGLDPLMEQARKHCPE